VGSTAANIAFYHILLSSVMQAGRVHDSV